MVVVWIPDSTSHGLISFSGDLGQECSPENAWFTNWNLAAQSMLSSAFLQGTVWMGRSALRLQDRVVRSCSGNRRESAQIPQVAETASQRWVNKVVVFHPNYIYRSSFLRPEANVISPLKSTCNLLKSTYLLPYLLQTWKKLTRPKIVFWPSQFHIL